MRALVLSTVTLFPFDLLRFCLCLLLSFLNRKPVLRRFARSRLPFIAASISFEGQQPGPKSASLAIYIRHVHSFTAKPIAAHYQPLNYRTTAPFNHNWLLLLPEIHSNRPLHTVATRRWSLALQLPRRRTLTILGGLRPPLKEKPVVRYLDDGALDDSRWKTRRRTKYDTKHCTNTTRRTRTCRR